MKKLLIVLFFSILLLGITGCEKTEVLSKEELINLQEEITDKVTEKEYHNFASCYVDEEENIIVVELVDNSNEAQGWFKENIIDSKYVTFKQGGPYTTTNLDFYISKPELYDSIKFNEYYKGNDRTIFLAGNISEFYIKNDSDKEVPLKEYISTTYQTIDDSIKSITNNLTRKDTLKDGGTSIYKSKSKDLTIIVCKTIEGSKDIYIGDYSLEYDQTMCS